MKRGSPGTIGDWNSVISSRSTSINGSCALGHGAGRFDRGPPFRPRTIEERVFAEKRVPPDVLAALDALEQKRVVGVFRDLQKRRHGREQVRHDLAAHGHERAMLRQLDELVERRLFHDTAPLPLFIDECLGRLLHDRGRRVHGPSTIRTDDTACPTSISSPPIVSAPASRAHASSVVSRGL